MDESTKLEVPYYGFDKPEPSLCDSCVHASGLGGGTVTIGSMSGVAKTYQQRYCPKPPKGQEDKPMGTAIHTHGYNECEYYSKKPESE